MVLARGLGFVGRRAMYAGDRQRPMTAEDLAEWEVLYGMDPWGPERADWAMGILCSLTDACHRMKGQVKGPAEYMLFLRDTVEEPAEQSVEDMKATWQAWAGD